MLGSSVSRECPPEDTVLPVLLQDSTDWSHHYGPGLAFLLQVDVPADVPTVQLGQ